MNLYLNLDCIYLIDNLQLPKYNSILFYLKKCNEFLANEYSYLSVLYISKLL